MSSLYDVTVSLLHCVTSLFYFAGGGQLGLLQEDGGGSVMSLVALTHTDR